MEAENKPVLVDKTTNGIAIITLNRPHALNALTPDMLVKLAFTFTRLDEDPTVKVIILTGAGRAFSAGVVTFLTSFSLSPQIINKQINNFRVSRGTLPADWRSESALDARIFDPLRNFTT